MTSGARRTFISGQVHVVTLYARLFAALAFLMLRMLKCNAETVEVSVNPQNLATPGPMNRRRIDSPALNRMHIQETKAEGRCHNKG
jgi:hypothetical protein